MKASGHSAKHSQDRWKGRQPSWGPADDSLDYSTWTSNPEEAVAPAARLGKQQAPGRTVRLQKLGVGFAGEWLAYQWLAQQYGPDFTQECWVSRYREQVLPGSGDDGLGWDFEVPVHSTSGITTRSRAR